MRYFNATLNIAMNCSLKNLFVYVVGRWVITLKASKNIMDVIEFWLNRTIICEGQLFWGQKYQRTRTTRRIKQIKSLWCTTSIFCVKKLFYYAFMCVAWGRKKMRGNWSSRLNWLSIYYCLKTENQIFALRAENVWRRVWLYIRLTNLV